MVSYLIHRELFQSWPAIPYEIQSAHNFPNEVSLKTVPMIKSRHDFRLEIRASDFLLFLS